MTSTSTSIDCTIGGPGEDIFDVALYLNVAASPRRDSEGRYKRDYEALVERMSVAFSEAIEGKIAYYEAPDRSYMAPRLSGLVGEIDRERPRHLAQNPCTGYYRASANCLTQWLISQIATSSFLTTHCNDHGVSVATESYYYCDDETFEAIEDILRSAFAPTNRTFDDIKLHIDAGIASYKLLARDSERETASRSNPLGHDL